MNLTDTIARYRDGTATPSDVCNAVIAEIAARPDAATIRDALAIIPDDISPDVHASLYDIGVSDEPLICVNSRCGGEEQPTPQPSPLAPEVLAAINAWWRA